MNPISEDKQALLLSYSKLLCAAAYGTVLVVVPVEVKVCKSSVAAASELLAIASNILLLLLIRKKREIS